MNQKKGILSQKAIGVFGKPGKRNVASSVVLAFFMLVILVFLLFACSNSGKERIIESYSFEGGEREFLQGDAFTLDDVTLHLLYQGGGEENVALTNEMLAATPDMTQFGRQTVKVFYNGEEYIYEITVLSTTVTGYDFSGLPRAFVGEEYNVTGGTLCLSYADGRTENVSIAQTMLSVSPDITAIGESRFTVLFGKTEYAGVIMVEKNPTTDILSYVQAFLNEDREGELSSLEVYFLADGRSYGKDFSIMRKMDFSVSKDVFLEPKKTVFKEALRSIITLPNSTRSWTMVNETPRFCFSIDDLFHELSSRLVLRLQGEDRELWLQVEDGVGAEEVRQLLELFETELSDMTESLFEEKDLSDPSLQDGRKKAIDGLLSILRADIVNYQSVFCDISDYVLNLSDRNETYEWAAIMLFVAMYANQMFDAGVDYNELMKNIPLPSQVEEINYNKFVERMMEERKEDNFFEVSPCTVTYQENEDGTFKAYVDIALHMTCDLSLFFLGTDVYFRMEILL